MAASPDIAARMQLLQRIVTHKGGGAYIGLASDEDLSKRKMAEVMAAWPADGKSWTLSSDPSPTGKEPLGDDVHEHFASRLVIKNSAGGSDPATLWPWSKHEMQNVTVGHHLHHHGGFFGLSKGGQPAHQASGTSASGSSGRQHGFGSLIVCILSKEDGILWPVEHFLDNTIAHRSCVERLKVLYSNYLFLVEHIHVL